MRTLYLLVIVCIMLLSGIAYKSLIASKVNQYTDSELEESKSNQEASPQQVMEEERPQADGLVEQKKGRKVKKVAKICSEQESVKAIFVSHERFIKLAKEGKVKVYSLHSASCFQAGQEKQLFSTHFENGFPFMREFRGKVEILSVNEESFSQLRVGYDLTNEEKLKFYKDINIRQRQEKNSDDRVSIMEVRFKSKLMQKKQYGTPLWHPHAKVLTKYDEVKKLLEKNVVLVDVRPFSMFSKGSLQGAMNLPMRSYEGISRNIVKPSDIRKLGWGFKSLTLIKNKKKAYILFSDCPSDYTSYNAINVLALNGYKRLFWFRTGYRPKGSSCRIPNKIAGVEIINADKLAAMRASSLKILDIREHQSSPHTIPGAIEMPFAQKRNALKLAQYRNPKMTAADLAKRSEKFINFNETDFPKNTPIVVFGKNEFAWPVYKAILTLKSKGYSSVFWYRKGFDDWRNHFYFDPQKFPITPQLRAENDY